MRVNQLARTTGVDAHTIRYYSRLGLLAPKRNPKNQYREYAPSDIERLLFIRQAKSLGFRLQEIELILREADAGITSPEACSILRKRYDEIQDSLTRLETLRIVIEAALDRWDLSQDSQFDGGVLKALISAFANAAESGCAGRTVMVAREGGYRVSIDSRE